tara:strand:- start:9570 stop:9782 length:213 start_codon:yes stop_codon:yes gene_type:complete
MNRFNAGDLSKKPSEVFAAARGEGAIIQHKDRQGKVVEEFVFVTKDKYMGINDLDEVVAFTKPTTESGWG